MVRRHERLRFWTSASAPSNTGFTSMEYAGHGRCPRSQRARAAIQRSDRPMISVDPSTLRVLVVDDVFENRELARMALEEEGYVVTCAANGAEALERFAIERPALVLLDIRMPRMDGFAVCERLRALE